MDVGTARIYAERAGEWEQRRRGVGAARWAQRLGARVPAGALRADLGCGPGFHFPALGEPLLALDVAVPMLERARTRGAGALAVCADLEALPLRRGALAGAWAAASYLHLPSTALPAALAQLHGVLRVEAPFHLVMREGRGDGVGRGGDFPGRYFADWHRDRLCDVVAGAGFEVEALHSEERGDDVWLRVEANRARSLADTVGPGMRMLVCGLNPSCYAADAGVGFARPGNRFWPAALRAGLLHRDRDPLSALAEGVGMTDLVKRATPRAHELRPDELGAGLARVERLVRWLEPGVVCFVGLAGWRAAVDRTATAGAVPAPFGGRPAYLMPSTSGANASSSLEDLVAHLRAAAALS